MTSPGSISPSSAWKCKIFESFRFANKTGRFSISSCNHSGEEKKNREWTRIHANEREGFVIIRDHSWLIELICWPKSSSFSTIPVSIFPLCSWCSLWLIFRFFRLFIGSLLLLRIDHERNEMNERTSKEHHRDPLDHSPHSRDSLVCVILFSRTKRLHIRVHWRPFAVQNMNRDVSRACHSVSMAHGESLLKVGLIRFSLPQIRRSSQ